MARPRRCKTVPSSARKSGVQPGREKINGSARHFCRVGRSQGYNRSCRRSGRKIKRGQIPGIIAASTRSLAGFRATAVEQAPRASAVVLLRGGRLRLRPGPRADRFTYRLVTQVAHCAFLFAPAAGLAPCRCRLPPDKPGLRLELSGCAGASWRSSRSPTAFARRSWVSVGSFDSTTR